jgi:DNA repair photolyase
MNGIYKRFDKTPAPLHLDEKELRVNHGSGNTIFVGSSCDMFANEVPFDWIKQVLAVCALENLHNNTFLFQTKNPMRFLEFEKMIGENSILCTTIETNFFIPEIMRGAPDPELRSIMLARMADMGYRTMVTVEPILDFNMRELLFFIERTKPFQVNIGADSGNNHLPEPPADKIRELIAELKTFTRVVEKNNLVRLLK